MIIFGIFGITIIIQLTHDWVTKFNAKRITFYWQSYIHSALHKTKMKFPQNGVYASPEDNHFLVVLTILNAKMLADHTV